MSKSNKPKKKKQDKQNEESIYASRKRFQKAVVWVVVVLVCGGLVLSMTPAMSM